MGSSELKGSIPAIISKIKIPKDHQSLIKNSNRYLRLCRSPCSAALQERCNLECPHEFGSYQGCRFLQIQNRKVLSNHPDLWEDFRVLNLCIRYSGCASTGTWEQPALRKRQTLHIREWSCFSCRWKGRPLARIRIKSAIWSRYGKSR